MGPQISFRVTSRHHFGKIGRFLNKLEKENGIVAPAMAWICKIEAMRWISKVLEDKQKHS